MADYERTRTDSSGIMRLDSSTQLTHSVDPTHRPSNIKSPMGPKGTLGGRNQNGGSDPAISSRNSHHGGHGTGLKRGDSSAHIVMAKSTNTAQNPRSNLQSLKGDTLVARLNQNSRLNRLGKFIRGPQVQFVTFLSVMWALFAQDVCFGWVMNKNLDEAFSITTIVVFTILAVEMLCHIFLTANYTGSYFMAIDLVGTALLVPEIFIYRESDANYASDSSGNSILGVARAGRVARTAAMVRVGRIAKVFRVLRTARAMQCLLMAWSVFEAWKERIKAEERIRKKGEERSKKGEAAAEDHKDEDVDGFDMKPSVFGLKYANLVSQRVVIGVLIILAVIPQLDVTELDYSREASIDVLYSWGNSCNVTEEEAAAESCRTTQGAAVENFLQKFSDCVYFSNYGQVAYRDDWSLEERRKTVMTRYTAGVSAAADDDPNSIVAIFDDQELESEVRMMNIFLTLFVVLIFSVGSWVFNNDAKTMIIRPIERLTALVKKLAGMVFMLSAEDDNTTLEEGNEMDFIDVIAGKMNDVFKKDSGAHKKASEAAGAMMPDGMARRPSVGSAAGFLFSKNPKIADKEAPSMEMDAMSVDSQSNEELVHSRPEFANLEACLHDSKARSYFRLFLSKEFNVENIAFWEAVHEYRILFRKRAKFIYTTYISQAAMYQINIPAAQRAKIKDMLTADNSVCSSDMFDKTHMEIFRLMARDPFPRFLKSDLAITFAKIAKVQDRTGQDDEGASGRTSESSKLDANSGRNVAPGGSRGGGGRDSDPDEGDASEVRDSVENMANSMSNPHLSNTFANDKPVEQNRERRRASRADLAYMLAK